MIVAKLTWTIYPGCSHRCDRAVMEYVISNLPTRSGKRNQVCSFACLLQSRAEARCLTPNTSWHLRRVQSSHLLLLSYIPRSRGMFSPPHVGVRIQYLWLHGGLSWLPEVCVSKFQHWTGSVWMLDKKGLNFSSPILWAICCTTQIFIHTVHTVELSIKHSHYIHLLCFTQSFPVLITGKLSLISQSPAGEW